MPTYLPTGFSKSIYNEYNVPLSYIHCAESKYTIFYDDDVLQSSCREISVQNGKKCDEERSRWIAIFKSALQKGIKLEPEIITCIPGNKMNRIFPVFVENSLLGLLIAGSINKLEEGQKPPPNQDDLDEIYLTENEFVDRTDVLSHFVEHIKHFYLAERDFNVSANVPFDFDKYLKDALYNLMTWKDTDSSAEFYREVLKTYEMVIPIELATIRFRHTEKDSSDNIAKDSAILKAIYSPYEKERKIETQVKDMPDHYLLRLDKGHSFSSDCFNEKKLIYLDDFTKPEHEFAWPELAMVLKARSYYIIPMRDKNDEAFATVGLFCEKGNLLPSIYFIEQSLRNITEQISLAVERFNDLLQTNRRRNFRYGLIRLIGKMGCEFFSELQKLVKETIPDSTHIDIWLWDHSEAKFRRPTEVGKDKDFMSYPNIENRPEYKVYHQQTDLRRPKPRLDHLDYFETYKSAGDELMNVIMTAPLNAITADDDKKVGVICCQQRINSFDEIATVFLKRDREYLEYMAFVVSILLGNLDYYDRANELMTILGHEVVKPMSYIWESVQLMDIYKRRNEQKKYNDRYVDLEENVNFAVYTTRNFNNLSQDLRLHVQDLYNFKEDILKRMVKYLIGYAEKERGILIRYSGDFPQNYYMDKNMMRQALFNIIMNAVKYSQRIRGEDVQIIGRENISANIWEIKVQDWGIGIPPKEKDRVFRYLSYCNNARFHDNTGIGIGGYITKRIIVLHGGDIEITSFKNPTEITIKLPLVR